MAAEQWGELRSIVHERRGVEALIGVLLDWPVLPEDDDVLQHYLMSHRDAWIWPGEQLPPTDLIEQWFRGRLLFLLGSPAVETSWDKHQPQRLLDIRKSWAAEDRHYFTFYWSITSLQELILPLDWLIARARRAVEDNSGKQATGKSSVKFMEVEVRSGFYDLEDPNDQPWLDLSLYEWSMRPGEIIFPCIDVELTTEGLSVWVDTLGYPSPPHWISLFELGWQIDKLMTGSRYVHLTNDVDEPLQNALTFYQTLRAACCLASRLPAR